MLSVAFICFAQLAYHPSSDESAANVVTWAVMGMSCDPARVTIDEYIDSNITLIENIATLNNTAGFSISHITASVRITFILYTPMPRTSEK